MKKWTEINKEDISKIILMSKESGHVVEDLGERKEKNGKEYVVLFDANNDTKDILIEKIDESYEVVEIRKH